MKLCLSIKTRLIIFALSISLIPMAIITVIHYLHAKNTLQQYILEKLRAVAQSKKMHILCFVETKKIRTADFSTDGFIRTKLDQCVRNEKYNQYAAIQLNKYLSTYKLPLSNNLKAIVIVDVNGKVISSTSEHLYGRDMSEMRYLSRENHGVTARSIQASHTTTRILISTASASLPRFFPGGAAICWASLLICTPLQT